MQISSFIIPSYNSSKTIGKTLESILAQTVQNIIKDIIVVDSSDDNKTRQLLHTFKDSRLRIIELPQKTSPAKGRNIGAQCASGELLCFIDSDVFIDRFWLSHVIDAYKQGKKVGAGSVSIPEFQKKNALARAQLYLQFNESLNVGDARPIAMVPACNMFIDQRLFSSLGGFPDIRASEDVLLCLNIGKFEQVWFIPKAKCFHIFREDRHAYFQNQIILGKYIIIYRRMLYDRWFYKGITPLILLPAFALIKAARIKMRVFKSGAENIKGYLTSLPLFIAGLFFWCVGFAQGSLKNEQ